MKLKLCLVVMCLLILTSWIFRWEKKEDPKNNLIEYRYDRYAHQSWTISLDANGKKEVPIFDSDRIEDFVGKYSEVFADDDIVKTAESTLVKENMEIKEMKNILAKNQAITKKFADDSKKLWRSSKTTASYFPPGDDGVCWVIDDSFYNKNLSQVEQQQITAWCNTNSLIEKKVREVERVEQALVEYRNQQTSQIKEEVAKSKESDRLKGKEILGKLAWEKRKQVTLVMMAITSLAVLLTLFVLLRNHNKRRNWIQS